MSRIMSKPFIIGAAAALAISGVGTYVWKEEHRPHILEVYVFALKSGRSVFVRTPEDKRILIDGGANSEVVAELTKILPFYSRRIDAVVVTNTEGKDVSGLIDVLKRYRVDRAYVMNTTLSDMNMTSSTDRIYETLVATLNDLKIGVHEIGAGERIDFDQCVSGNVIFPVSSSDFQYSKASAPEILLNLSFGSTSITLFGDVSPKIQKYLVSEGEVKHSDVLVVSSNASSGNLSSLLVDAIRPRFLVYSKSLPKSSSSSSSKKIASSHTSEISSKPKKLDDPLATILLENRFNIQEKGTVKIISDGKTVSVR